MVRILFVSLFFLMISCKKKSETSSSCEQPATNLSGIWKGFWVLPPDPPYNSQTGQICTRIVQTGSLIDGKLYDIDNSSQFFDSVDINGNICGSVVNLRTDTMVYFNIKILAKFNGNVVYDTSGGTFKIQAPQNNYESSDGTWWMKRDTAASCK